MIKTAAQILAEIGQAASPPRRYQRKPGARLVNTNWYPVVRKTREGSQLLCGLDDCGRKHHGLGFCLNHYRKFIRWGDPLAGPRKRETDAP